VHTFASYAYRLFYSTPFNFKFLIVFSYLPFPFLFFSFLSPFTLPQMTSIDIYRGGKGYFQMSSYNPTTVKDQRKWRKIRVKNRKTERK
jgi:hypothetical protein